jgi:pterin-4a-carbinolamine dehydratase
MEYKGLYILIEGNDDKRFFDNVIIPKLKKKYGWIKTWCYAQKKKENIVNFINAIKSMNADYIYVVDIDNSPCITFKKQNTKNKIEKINENKIIVVIKEIEGWYLAGLDNKASQKLKIKHYTSTDGIIKEQFNSIIPKKFDSRIDFMNEILKLYSIDVAKNKNNSFKYFADKYL